jgi:hypothetical protein
VIVSQLDSKSTRPAGILVRRQKANIYTVLLGVALAAMVISCLLLHLELASYGGFKGFFAFPWKTGL